MAASFTKRVMLSALVTLFCLASALKHANGDNNGLHWVRDAQNTTGTAASSNASRMSTSKSFITVDVTTYLTISTGTGPLGTASRNIQTSTANITGLASASSCNLAKQEWISNSGQVFVSNTTVTTSTLNVSYTIIRSDWTETFLSNPHVYTLCDGYPRLNGSTSITGIDTTPATTSTVFFPTLTAVSRNVSAPSCIISSDECAVLQAEYTSSSNAYDAYNAQSGSMTLPPVSWPTSPICGQAILPNRTSMTLPPAACAVDTATMQLLYWPIATTSGDLCHGNGSTITATPTILGHPNTVVYMNNTLTSPTVYMAFKNLWKVDADYVARSSFQQTLLPLSASTVSSRCGKIGGGFGSPLSMNYADLNWPVPANAYRCQPKCFTNDDLPQYWTDYSSTYEKYATENQCSTIWDDYAPALSVPAEFATVFPSAGFDDMIPGLPCTFILNSQGDNVFFDPPYALQQAPTVAGPSLSPVTPGAPDSLSQTQSVAGPSLTAGGGAATTTKAKPASVGVPTIAAQTQSNAVPAKSDQDPTTAATNSAPRASLPDPSPAVDPTNVTPQVERPSKLPGGTQGGGNNPGTIGPTIVSQDPPADPARPSASTALSQPPSPGDGVSSNSPGDSSQQADPTAKPVDPTTSNSASRGVGDIIASVLGMTSTPGDNTVSTPAVDSGTSNAGAGDEDPPASAAILTGTGGLVFTAVQSSGNVILGSATVAVGATSNIPGIGSILAQSGGVVVHGHTQAFTAMPPKAVADAAQASGSVAPTVGTIDGQAFTVLPQAGDPSAVEVANGGTTITGAVGSVATLGGHIISIPSAGGAVIGTDDNAITLAPSQDAADTGPSAAAVVTIGGSRITENAASGFVIGSQTLMPGKSGIIVSGTTYSLLPSGTALVANGATQNIAPSPAVTSEAAVYTVGGQTLTEGPSAEVVIAGTTLQPGRESVILGTTYSLDASGSALIVNGVTHTIQDAPTTTSAVPYFTVDSKTITEGPLSDIVISGLTLRPGSVTVIAGTTYSLAPSGGDLVVDGSTQAVQTPHVSVTSSTADISLTETSSGSAASGTSNASVSAFRPHAACLAALSFAIALITLSK